MTLLKDDGVLVVGSGLTGMSISYVLGNAAIPHVVVGRRPDSLPRLGESLNLEGTLLLREFCGEFSRFFWSKKLSTAFIGDYVLQCPFNIAKKRTARVFFKLLGTRAPEEFLHIDRLGLDVAIYDRMLTSPSCRVIDAEVEAVNYDTRSDRVTSVALSDGSVLEPAYVFDASNHKRIMAEAIGVPYRVVGPPQRVVYTHFHPGETLAPKQRPEFDVSTNLLRMFPSIDGIDAVAWYIPLPAYVSVGVSMTDETNQLSDDEVLVAAEEGYARRGLRYRDRFPVQSQTMTLRHRYFSHERAFGANWLLAGGTYASVWWTAGAGVGISFAAAKLAVELLADPIGRGRAYEQYLNDLLPIQDTFDWLANTSLEDLDVAGLQEFSDRFLRTNVHRLARSSRLQTRRTPLIAGQVLAALVRTERVPSQLCRVMAVPIADQTCAAFGSSDGLLASNEETVLRLAEIIGGEADMALSDRLLDPEVVCHMDGWMVTGRHAWRTWVQFIRTRRRTPGLGLVDRRAACLADGRIELTGHWRTARRRSDEVAATYRVEGGRIVEIWTTRSNYVFMLGPLARSRAGMSVLLGYAGVVTAARRRLPARAR